MKIFFYSKKRKKQPNISQRSNQEKMKMIYYLRGIGMGILLTAIIIGVEIGGNTTKMRDAVVIKGEKQQKILEMHNQGKSDVAIARELCLGLGDVKQVIDFFGKH